MAIFEILFSFSIVLMLFCYITSSLRHSVASYLIVLGVVLLILHFLIEGWRWQLVPTYIVFVSIMLLRLIRSTWRVTWRVISALPLIAFFATSSALIYLMPINDLPEPIGPYGVGTFEYTLEDASRTERFDPEINRRLYVQVWYPSEKASARDYPVRSLWHNLSRSEFGAYNFLVDYLENMSTNSHINAPIVTGTRLPVLLFNEGFMMWPDSNSILMEHLASQGYVIFSIGHPYENLLASRDTDFPRLAQQVPNDVTRGESSSPEFLYFASGGDIAKSSSSASRREKEHEVINALIDQFELAPDIETRNELVKVTLDQGTLNFLDTPISQETLSDFLMTRLHMNLSTKVWVEDTQYVANNLSKIDAPIDDFLASLSLDGFGIFGMSFGGSVAGEFCKIDNRCIAGSNLDGQQWGHNWRDAPKAPFLRWRHEGLPGSNDTSYSLSKFDFYDYEVTNTFHGDFMDLPFVLPNSDGIGLRGSIDPMRILEIINTMQLKFFDKYMKDSSAELNGAVLFPEIVERTNMR